MQYGFVFPRGDARTASEFAREAEIHGWDGFFVWEPVYGIDAWVSLAAAAMVTSRIRLGTMLTPLSRMRPWKIASEAVTLDQLSGGRVILATGLGAIDCGFDAFGEVTDRNTRASLLDESLQIIPRLWSGEFFDFDGQHYHVHLHQQIPGGFPDLRPVQQPRIPIWVVGAYPRSRSLLRACAWDGLLPAIMGADGKVRMSAVQPEELRQIVAWVNAHRKAKGVYDFVIEGVTPGNNPLKARAQVLPYIEAGATWWIEALWETPDPDQVLARLRQGPPR
ncbi:MAG TPA: LLM class flavin-dependent oxidoreductase [Anaerolineaceae bacterium]